MLTVVPVRREWELGSLCTCLHCPAYSSLSKVHGAYCMVFWVTLVCKVLTGVQEVLGKV